jgi:OOP family OmpA-OmpF porin
MTKQLKLSALVAAMLVSATSFAAKSGYAVDANDSVVRDNYNECWKTSSFDKEANGLVECGDKAAAAPAAVEAPKAAPMVEVKEKVTLSAKVLFNFDKATLRADAKNELDPLVARLKDDANLKSVEIDGYTDFMGTEKYNLNLSQKRADAVRDYFTAAGISNDKIVTMGKGNADAKFTDECKSKFKYKRHAANTALKACLEPDRRVELNIDTFKVVEQPAK